MALPVYLLPKWVILPPDFATSLGYPRSWLTSVLGASIEPGGWASYWHWTGVAPVVDVRTPTAAGRFQAGC